jgi:hypothetical protein
VRPHTGSLHVKERFKLLLREMSTLNCYEFSIVFLTFLKEGIIVEKLIYSGFRHCVAAINFEGREGILISYFMQCGA